MHASPLIARDMYRIVSQWSEFVVPVHDQYPHLLAEMFAYCLAAAHLQLPHQTANSFMVSDVGTGRGEGWDYVDALSEDQVCALDLSVERMPNLIHFCQRYGVGLYFFGKRRLPKDFLSCASPLLRELPADYRANYVHWPNGNDKKLSKTEVKRHRFMLCHLIPAVNAAASYYKRRHCDVSQANFEKTLTFNAGLDE